MKGAIFFKIDDELEALLVEPHHSLGLLEGLLQYVPNKNSFYELIPLRECAHSRMMDYDASDFSGILETPPSKRDIEPINSFESNRDQNMEFAKRLYGYPLGAKLAAYGVANFGYSYYLKQPPKIQSLKVSLAKQLISHAQLSPECQEYLKIVALCKSKLRNEEYVSIFPTLNDEIAKLSDEAFFAGVTKFDDDGCYQLEAIVEDYFYELAFALPNRKELCNKVGVYLSNHLKDASRDEYLRLVPVAVHVLLLSGQFANAIALRSELIETIVSTM